MTPIGTRYGGRPRRDPTPLPNVNHGIYGYQQGCGCGVCSEAKRESNARDRERRKGCKRIPIPAPSNVRKISEARQKVKKPKTVVDVSDSIAEQEDQQLRAGKVGIIEKAVIEETSGLSIAQERPGMVATARSMARILDNPKQAALHPTSSRQLTQILNDLRGQSKKRTRSRLASVQRMTSNETPTGTK